MILGHTFQSDDGGCKCACGLRFPLRGERGVAAWLSHVATVKAEPTVKRTHLERDAARFARERVAMRQPDLAPVTHVCTGCGVSFSSPRETQTQCLACERGTTVKRPGLFGEVIDTGRTEAQLNGWTAKDGGTLTGWQASQGKLAW